MARINVEQQALIDPRFRRLGIALGCPSRFASDAGRGIMERIWNELTERWSEEAGPAAYCASSETLRSLFAGLSYTPSLWSAIVSSDLGSETEFGLRIHGTLGRIEWLNRRRGAARDNGRLGGRKPNSVNPLSPAPAPIPEEMNPDSEVECIQSQTIAGPRNADAASSLSPTPKRKRNRSQSTDEPDPQGFQAWWVRYAQAIKPRPMRDKDKCRLEWKARDLETYSDPMLGKLDQQVQYRQENQGNGTFIPALPDPIRYLKRRLWKEELQ